jgi:hypothetical protein
VGPKIDLHLGTLHDLAAWIIALNSSIFRTCPPRWSIRWQLGQTTRRSLRASILDDPFLDASATCAFHKPHPTEEPTAI